jgi:hypothetical protein
MWAIIFLSKNSFLLLFCVLKLIQFKNPLAYFTNFVDLKLFKSMQFRNPKSSNRKEKEKLEKGRKGRGRRFGPGQISAHGPPGLLSRTGTPPPGANMWTLHVRLITYPGPESRACTASLWAVHRAAPPRNPAPSPKPDQLFIALPLLSSFPLFPLLKAPSCCSNRLPKLADTGDVYHQLRWAPTTPRPLSSLSLPTLL